MIIYGFKFNLEQYTSREIEKISKIGRIKIANNSNDILNFIEESVIGNNQGHKLLLGKISENLANKIKVFTNINFKNYSLELRADEIKHIFKFHTNDVYEAQRGQREVVKEDIFAFTDIINDFDYIEAGNRKNSFVFVKRNSKDKINAVTHYSNKYGGELFLKTMMINSKRGNQQVAST